MDIKELVEWVAKKLFDKQSLFPAEWDWATCKKQAPITAPSCEKLARQILSNPNLAWVIRDGDTIPLGVEIETHHVVLLKKALKEVKDE